MSEEKKKVSVILDNYNYARFLPEAIESVLNQTYENFELIIVDDGSVDGSQEIIENYARENSERLITVFKENGGQTSAFNAAFSFVSGDIVAFLDSDDYWYPNKLEKIVRKHEDFQLVQHYLSYNGNGIYREVNTSTDWHLVLKKYGYLYNHSVCSSLSFDRRLLEPFFPLVDESEMIYCTDGVLLMIALSITKVGFIEEELGFYRVHDKNGFVGKTDFGQRAREILQKQHIFVNKQLRCRGKEEILFSNHRYFLHILRGLLAEGKLKATNRIVVYGTESSGLYMTDVLEELGLQIVLYADSDTRKQGTQFMKREIVSPDELLLRKDEWDVVLIASSAQKAISKGLTDRGLIEAAEFYPLPI